MKSSDLCGVAKQLNRVKPQEGEREKAKHGRQQEKNHKTSEQLLPGNLIVINLTRLAVSERVKII